MKTIIFYGRTQVGSAVLSYLVAKGYNVRVIPEDEIVDNLCRYYRLQKVTFDTMGTFDLFVCCHGSKIIEEQYLQQGTFVNMHSCLWKYKGKDPISRYIANGDTDASIESHYMVKEVDAGEVISRVLFTTPVVSTHGEYFNIALPHYYQCIEETLNKIFRPKTAVAMVRINDQCKTFGVWLDYYSRYFDELRVFAFNVSEEWFKPYSKYKFKVINSTGGIYSTGAHSMVFEAQKELVKEFDWTFYSDADEFVVPDSAMYKDLRDYIEKCNEDVAFTYGYQVVRAKNENEINYASKPVLMQRSLWMHDSTGSYNKPVLARIPCDWTEGFHKRSEMTDDEAKEMPNKGLYMVHIKHINDAEGLDQISGDEPEAIPEYIKQLL